MENFDQYSEGQLCCFDWYITSQVAGNIESEERLFTINCHICLLRMSLYVVYYGTLLQCFPWHAQASLTSWWCDQIHGRILRNYEH